MRISCFTRFFSHIYNLCLTMFLFVLKQLIRYVCFVVTNILSYCYRKMLIEIALQRNKHTTFYLFSDGYEDQFGGEKDRKFSSRQLRELLLNIQTNDMETQHLIIKNTMKSWQGKTKQIDDMLIIGVKV